MKAAKKPAYTKKTIRQKAEEMFSVAPEYLHKVLEELYEDYQMGKMALKAEKSGLANKKQVMALLKCK